MAASEGELRGRLPSLGKYDIIEEIGHGGMATVYRARDPRLNRDVAVKVIHPHLRDSPEVAHRFHVEAQAVAKLRHPNIVEVYDVSAETDREQYLVVELVRGRTLRGILQDRSPLPPEVAAAIALQLLGALAHAHDQGVVHRDIKPENVLVEMGGEGASTTETKTKIKLTDFGIAKLLDSKGVTSTGQVLGSPAHMAPEQIEGGEVDARSDVFGMGVLLYECMVGHLPFEGANPAQVLRRVLDGHYPSAEMELGTVGKSWSTILDRALAHDANGRYANATDMESAINEELARLAVTDAPAEVATYLSDVDAYESAHDQRMVDALCALGAAARKRNDAISAANDYNRALAYSPNDPALLKLVTTIHAQSARVEMLKKGAPALALMVGAMALAFFATRALKGITSGTTISTVPSASAQTVSSAPSITAEPSTRPVPSASAHPTPTVSTTVRIPAIAPTPSLRKLNFVSVKPLQGVTVSIDDAPPEGISAGSSIDIDNKPHVLRFGCVMKDVCETDTRMIAEGKTDDAMSIELKVKPASVIVMGDPTVNYGIAEHPQSDVKVGSPVSVNMRGGGSDVITIIDRKNPTVPLKTVNISAGQQVTVQIP